MAEFSPSAVDDLAGDSEGLSGGSDADVEASDDEEASGEQDPGQTADMEEDEPEARYACALLCYNMSCLTHNPVMGSMYGEDCCTQWFCT